MHTFIVIVQATPAEELLKYHQIFWAVVAVLYADYQQEFLYGLKVLEAFFAKLDFNDPRIYKHFMAALPSKCEPPFTGLQPLLLKGLTSELTEATTFQVLFHPHYLQQSANHSLKEWQCSCSTISLCCRQRTLSLKLILAPAIVTYHL